MFQETEFVICLPTSLCVRSQLHLIEGYLISARDYNASRVLKGELIFCCFFVLFLVYVPFFSPMNL